MNWLELNKEWVFSGIGLLVISSITSLFSISLTLWWKSKQEKRKTKQLGVDEEITKFSISSPNKISPDDIKTSYKGKEYENLYLYTVTLTNIGFNAIENQYLHIIIPSEAEIIDKIEYKPLKSMEVNYREIPSKENKECIYKLARLENHDTYTISYLLDMKNEISIKYDLRGVNNITYVDNREIQISILTILKLLSLTAFGPIGGAAVELTTKSNTDKFRFR